MLSYQLQRDGNPVGLFDKFDTSAREQGEWVGYGKWRPLPKAKAAPTQVAKIDANDDSQSDVQVLHRKHHAGDSGAGDSGGGGSGSGSGAGSSGAAPDPDRPTLHKGGDTSTASSGGSSPGGSGQTNSGSGSGSNSGADSNAPPSDPDRPVLHHTDDSRSAIRVPGQAAGPVADSGRPQAEEKEQRATMRVTLKTSPKCRLIPTAHICPMESALAGYGALCCSHAPRLAARHATDCRHL